MSEILISFRGQSSSGFGQLVADRYDPSAGNFLPVGIHALCPPIYETSQFAMGEVDWKETRKAHIIRVDDPGVKKEQVKVEVQEGVVLLISGEREEEEEEENSYVWHRMERSFGNFHRGFNQPED